MIKQNSYKCVGLLAITLAMGAGLFLMFPKNHQESSEITNQLNNIQSQLSLLQTTIKTPAEKIDLSFINQDVNRLANLIGDLKTNKEDERSQLTNKLDAIHSVINSLNKKQHPITFLPISALPFKIISIDSIQQVSVASVAYDYKTMPL